MGRYLSSTYVGNHFVFHSVCSNSHPYCFFPTPKKLKKNECGIWYHCEQKGKGKKGKKTMGIAYPSPRKTNSSKKD